MNYYSKIVELSGHVLLNNQDEAKKGQIKFKFFNNPSRLLIIFNLIGTRNLIIQFLRYINENFKQELDLLLEQLNKDVSKEIIRYL